MKGDGACMHNILEIKNLSVKLPSPAGDVLAVRDVSLELRVGETLAIVGESGCGKSMLCKSIMRLLPEKAIIEGGQIIVDGRDIAGIPEREMTSLRGRLFSYIFQDPMKALDATMTIGQQIAESVLTHGKGLPAAEVRGRTLELLGLVGISRPEEYSRLYSYELSGGMRQRCVMAIALASNPRILLADEPTNALDVTLQAQLLELLRIIQRKQNMSTILVSHDMGAVARIADRVAIMYAGKIVELGTAEDIFYTPMHPYTRGLLRSLPINSRGRDRLDTIPGMPPSLIGLPKGDAFACRNPEALPIDFVEEPPMFKISDTHFAATWTLKDTCRPC